jgi:hypothetical protein
MTDVLHKPAMLVATLLAILTVTATLWVALAMVRQPDTMQQRSARIHDLAPPIQVKLLPLYLPSALPAAPVAPAKPHG